MAPQKFADLGKEARDLHSKNFHANVFELEAKTKSQGNDFTTKGTYNTETGDVAASLETKFTVEPYGVNITKKWNTDNLITLTAGVENKLIDGLKADLDTAFSPVTGKKSLKLKTAYKNGDLLHGTADVDLTDPTGPSVSASAVLAYQGVHLGVQGSYDTASKALGDNNLSLTYKQGDLVAHAGVVNLSKYVASVHHQVNSDLSAAAIVNYAAGASSFAVAGKYSMGGDAFMKAKLDNNLVLGCSYAQNLRPGLQLTLSGLLNVKALDQGGHKLGLSLNFAA